MVTVLWAVFGLVVVGLVLWYGGIIGGSNGGGDVVAQEESTDNGNGGETAEDTESNGDETAEGNGNGEGAESDADENGNGEEADVTAEGNGDDEEADDQTVSVFTSEQADRGQESFSQHCAECHGGQLDGEPPLTGDAFTSTWEGMPVNALYEVISQTMPLDSPGSLDEETYNDVTAHILAFNGMPDGDSELQSGDAQSMETLISFDGGGENEQADEGDGEGAEQADGDEAEGDEAEGDGQAGNGDEAEGDEQAADDDEEAGTSTDEAADENGDAEADASDGNGDSEADGETLELEETADGQPGADEGWIDLTVEPESATVHVLGPMGYLGQLQGGTGTLTGLEPGSYVFAASLGNFSHRVDAQVVQNQTVPVHLRIAPLADSPDVSGAGQDGQGGETNGNGGASAEGEESGNGDGGSDQDAEGNGNGEDGAAEGDSAGNGENDGNGDGEGNGEENGDDADSSDGNGDDAWYTDEQAETGSEDYSASCASCHGDDGAGDPPLVDGALEGSYDTVWDLFDYTSTEMPQDEPGSLDEETYVNIVAHLLALNDYPSGDEELTADEDEMSDMSLNNGNGGGDSGGESTDSEESGDGGEQADGGNGENGNAQETEGTAAERGASLYASNCAMCHGPTLHGVDAPPLAGPVFMERWGGHPVDWLYFQAHTSMPPDQPGSLDDQAYVDIIVHVLAENGILEGDEEFLPDDILLRGIIIGGFEQQDATLENRIESLRRTLHEPFTDAEAEEQQTTAPQPGGPQSPVSFRHMNETTEDTETAGEDGAQDQADDGAEGEDDGADGNGEAGDAGGNGEDNGEEDADNGEEDDGTEDDVEAAEDEGGAE